MMTVLLTVAAGTGTGWNVKGLVMVAVVFAIVYPLQKRLRAWVSRRRLARWRAEDDERDRTDDES